MGQESVPGQLDLLAVIEPTADELERPIGLIDGPQYILDELGWGLRCWCGPAVGWRELVPRTDRWRGVGENGEARPIDTLMLHQGRLTASLHFDLGPRTLGRARDGEPEPGDRPEEYRPQMPVGMGEVSDQPEDFIAGEYTGGYCRSDGVK